MSLQDPCRIEARRIGGMRVKIATGRVDSYLLCKTHNTRWHNNWDAMHCPTVVVFALSQLVRFFGMGAR